MCNSDIVDDYGGEEVYDGSGEDYYYYYYDEMCPNGVLNCTLDMNGYEYVYYNLYELFGDCSKKLQVPRSEDNSTFIIIINVVQVVRL